MSKFFKSIWSFFLLCGAFVCPARAQQQADLPPGLDGYIRQVLDSFDVPGVGVGIVRDGKVILAKGYGVKKLGDPAPVDANTLFCIASNSKAFTASSLAILVDEGKLHWDDKVVDYLPWFKLSDLYVTQHLTIRDLLVHQSGIPAYVNDVLLFPPSTYTRKELLSKLKDVPLKYDFRTVYAYDNIMYLAAGEIIGIVSGMPWEDFVKTRIFDPVGMTNSICRFSTLRDQPNIAYSHVKREGKLQVIDNYFDQIIGDAGDPAGGVASSAADMSKWLITQLDSGRTPGSERIFTPAATEELWKIVRPMPIGKVPEWLKPTQKNFSGYCLGFRTYDYRGYKIVGHGGLLTGFVSQIAMVPEMKLGVVVLTNQLSESAYWAIIYHILDYYMKAQSFDWLSGYKKDLDLSEKSRDSLKKARPDHHLVADTALRATLSLEDYAGVYHDELIGNALVTVVDDHLHIRFVKAPVFDGDLTHFQGDMFNETFAMKNRGSGPILSFALNPDKTVREARFISSYTHADGDLEDLVLKPDKQAIMDTTALRKRILTLTSKFPKGRFGVAFRDLGTGETFLINDKQLFHAASTMKTPVMAEVFKQAAAHKFSLSDSITVYNKFKSIADGSRYEQQAINDSEQDLYLRIGSKVTINDLLTRMITKSSNLATNIIIDLVGAKNVMKSMKDIGATDIKVLRGVEDDKAFKKGLNNMVTAYDLMLLFEQMGKGALVDQPSSDAMIAILKKQYFRSMIPQRLPDGVQVANKTGSITGICHDSGLVFLPDGRKYALVLLSAGLEEQEAKDTLALISEFVYNYMINK